MNDKYKISEEGILNLKINEAVLLIEDQPYILEEFLDEHLVSETTMRFVGSDTAGVFHDTTIIGLFLKYKKSNHKNVELLTDPKDIDKYKLAEELKK